MKRPALLLLFSWLIGGAAFAQTPPSAGPLPVDTRAECVALGGAWLASRDTWRAVCQVPWAREDCFKFGGGWTPAGGAPGGGYCIAQVSESATMRQCTGAGGTWGPPGSSMPYCQPAVAQAKPPLRRASDANMACGRQGDCIYGCVYRGPELPTGTTVKGVCRATNQVEGCDSMVEGGRLVGSICKR